MDNRITTVDLPSSKFMRNKGLSYFIDGDNHDYFTKEAVNLIPKEVDRFIATTDDLYAKLMSAARYVADQNLWELAGIPANAVTLVRHSLLKERALHLIGRFDFAGGVEDTPISMLEFNADTCSLMPETAYVSVEQTAKARKKKLFIFNNLINQLAETFQAILAANSDKNPNLLLSYLGNEEDYANLEVIAEAARKAGFLDVRIIHLEKVVFSEDEGIFTQEGAEEYTKYDFFFKMFPWDYVAYEESELMDIFTNIVIRKHAIILNPAFTMLLQSKSLLKFLYDRFPNRSGVLKSTFQASDFPDFRFVKKPFYGRTGDNVSIFDGKPSPVAENDGDFGDFPFLYQELVQLDQDEEGDYYQPSMFWSKESCALCFRRQEDMIVDDDAEYLCHLIER